MSRERTGLFLPFILLGIALAAGIYANPLAANQYYTAAAIAGVVIAVIYGTTSADTSLPLTRLLACIWFVLLAAVGILFVLDFPQAPMAAWAFLILTVLLLIGAAIVLFRRPATTGNAGNQSVYEAYDPNANLLELLISRPALRLQVEFAQLRVALAGNLATIQTTEATLPSRLDAVNSANAAAAKAGVHPDTFHGSTYQEKKLEAEVNRDKARFDATLEVDKRRDTLKVEHDAITNVAVASIEEVKRFADSIADLKAKLAKVQRSGLEPEEKAQEVADIETAISITRRLFHERFGYQPDGEAPPAEDARRADSQTDS